MPMTDLMCPFRKEVRYEYTNYSHYDDCRQIHGPKITGEHFLPCIGGECAAARGGVCAMIPNKEGK